MRKLKILIPTTICLLIMSLTTSAAGFKRVKAGMTAPTFQLTDYDGESVNLKDYADTKLTIVTFWASWSQKSLDMLDNLKKLSDEFSEHGLYIIAINAEGQDPPPDIHEKVKMLAEEKSYPFPMPVDTELDVYGAWGVVAVPGTAILTKGLKVEYEFSGNPSSAYEDMRQKVMSIFGIEEEKKNVKKSKHKRYEAAKKDMLTYGMAFRLYNKGRTSKAVKKIDAVLTSDPNYPDPYALKGVILARDAQGGKVDAEAGAREAFAKAVELDPTLPVGLAGSAHFALIDGDQAKSLEHLKTALEYFDDFPEKKAEAAEGDEPKGKVATLLEAAGAAIEAGDNEAGQKALTEAIEAIFPKGKKKKMKMMMNQAKQ